MLHNSVLISYSSAGDCSTILTRSNLLRTLSWSPSNTRLHMSYWPAPSVRRLCLGDDEDLALLDPLHQHQLLSELYLDDLGLKVVHECAELFELELPRPVPPEQVQQDAGVHPLVLHQAIIVILLHPLLQIITLNCNSAK